MSVTKAAKEWGVSRTTIYQKFSSGELSRTTDKKIDTAEMLRVFGEPVSKKRTERPMNNLNSTHLNSHSIELEHTLELEKLKNEYLQQKVSEQKQLIENYQQQIGQLNKTLEKANASIHDFAQVRLLEFKQSKTDNKLQSQTEVDSSIIPVVEQKKRWWIF